MGDLRRDPRHLPPNAIVIGGWAWWLHNKAAKSHDIDIIVSSADLDDMRQALELTENSHFGPPKWRGTYDGIHLDIYVTYRSRLGTRLQLPVEHLVGHRLDIDGYPTLNKEALLVAKSAARLDRPDTLPGRKDAEDMALMILGAPTPWDWPLVHAVAQFSRSTENQEANWCSTPYRGSQTRHVPQGKPENFDVLRRRWGKPSLHCPVRSAKSARRDHPCSITAIFAVLGGACFKSPEEEVVVVVSRRFGP